ncbi:MAG TPA: hypothetical protein ENO21_04850, partial [Firmicutes bacterium]|nr:hypothetical protein [Bacillota bacterium]
MRAALLLLAGIILALTGGAAAQDEMLLGGFELEVQAGYSGYALPVANSQLGRDWADRGPLAWQMAFNYSTVPVRITILHRRADAFRGRIELISTAAFSIEEDPLGHTATTTTDFIVPPSVPYTVSLAPRVCPPSTPGGPARLLLRIYQQGLQTPVDSQVVTVTQLEPAYLYSLLLDGPPGDRYSDAVNPDNELELAMPDGFDAVDGLLTSRHWLISCPREQVTGLPLAARDFAFVVADLSEVVEWDDVEQRALVQYVIGGGHLCLYNVSTASWQGLNLDSAALPAGRGFVRVVRGGLDQARLALSDWLAGELEEFTLLCGGTAGGDRLALADSSENLLASLDLDDIFASSEESEIPSHRPGYLHPVWVYREACRSGAQEPWQGPEFLVNEPRAWMHNEALRQSIGANMQFNVPPLAHAASAPRELPRAWKLFAVLLPALLLLGGLVRQLRLWTL